MSIERVLLGDERMPDGYSAAPTSEAVAVKRRSRGRVADIVDLGHREHGQTIHKHFELRTHSETCELRDDGRIAPGETAAVVMSASAALSLSLVVPPAVPDIQLPIAGSARRRTWATEVMIYHGQESTVTWPAGVRFARVGYDMATLTEIPGPPPNPRPSGTADLFGVRYLEATGEWWVFPLAVGVASAAPGDAPSNPPPPPPGEDPANPEEPGEDGAPPPDQNPPEGDYTDPDTGAPIVPEQPPAKEGLLVALHNDAISFSSDLGSTWRALSGSPIAPDEMATSISQGILVRAGEDIYHAPNLGAWSRVNFDDEIFSERPIPNGNFEFGALATYGDGGEVTGWVRLSGTPPLISDATVPAQREGSAYYLARDPLTSGPGDFEIAQFVPVSAFSGTPTLRADAFCRPGAEVTVGMRTVVASGFATFNFVGTGSTATTDVVFNVGHSFTVPNQYTRAAASTDMRWALTEVASGLSPNVRAIADGVLSFDSNQNSGRFAFEVSFLDGIATTDSFQVQIGAGTRLTVSGIQGAASAELVSGNGTWSGSQFTATVQSAIRIRLENCSKFLFAIGGPEGGGNVTFTSSDASALDISATLTGGEAWTTFEATGQLPAGLTEVEVYIRATGNPVADVFVDNVRLGDVTIARELVRAAAYNRAADRHVIATDQALYAYAGGAYTQIGTVPADAALLSTSGETAIMSDTAAGIWLSTDSGATWTQLTPPSTPVQVIASPRPVVVCDGGQVLDLSSGAVVQVSSIAPGGRLAWSSRFGTWLSTSPSGAVSRSDDLATWAALASQPAGGAGARRTVPTQEGRLIGYADGVKDLFHSDSPADGWKQSYSLLLPIIDIQELR